MAERPHHRSAARVKLPRILMVDDCDDSREIYSLYMSYAGWETETAGSGEDALVVARVFRPDVVILDMAMPGLSGLEVARLLRQDLRLSSAWIVAFSAFDPDEAGPAAIAAGCNAFIGKPCLPQDLHRSVTRALLRRSTGLRRTGM